MKKKFHTTTDLQSHSRTVTVTDNYLQVSDSTTTLSWLISTIQDGPVGQSNYATTYDYTIEGSPASASQAFIAALRGKPVRSFVGEDRGDEKGYDENGMVVANNGASVGGIYVANSKYIELDRQTGEARETRPMIYVSAMGISSWGDDHGLETHDAEKIASLLEISSLAPQQIKRFEIGHGTSRVGCEAYKDDRGNVRASKPADMSWFGQIESGQILAQAGEYVEGLVAQDPSTDGTPSFN